MSEKLEWKKEFIFIVKERGTFLKVNLIYLILHYNAVIDHTTGCGRSYIYFILLEHD